MWFGVSRGYISSCFLQCPLADFYVRLKEIQVCSKGLHIPYEY